MPDYVIRRLVVALNRTRQAVNGSRIMLLGLAYKRNTGDDRESPAVVVAERLLALGAQVLVVDPHVTHDHIEGNVERVELSADELAAADAVVLLTDHDAFDLALVGRHARYVLDTRRRLSPGANVEFL
jgi:UDP-N-acetyl-D-glucosamine dehydrogenase